MKSNLNTAMALGFLGMIVFYSCNSNDSTKNMNSEETAKMDEIMDDINQVDYLTQGKRIAEASQATLGKNLMNAINKGGTKYAVEFCNVEAIPLTDSMANELGASVRRVTDKPRNSNNQADESQLSLIKSMKEEMKDGNAPKPQVVEMNGKMVGYYAIVTNAMCLNCHGDKDVDIEPGTYAKIKALYPSDKATGYATNELRGMWVVEMNKK